MRWPKYWSFSFNLSPSDEHPGLISFSIEWLDLLAAQGTLKSLLQHHSSKASILWHSGTYEVSCISLTFLAEFGRKVGKALFFSSDPRRSPSFTCLCRAVRRKLRVLQGLQGRRWVRRSGSRGLSGLHVGVIVSSAAQNVHTLGRWCGQAKSHVRQFCRESSFLGRLIRSLGPSRKRKGQKFFLHCFLLGDVTMYLAQGQVSP